MELFSQHLWHINREYPGKQTPNLSYVEKQKKKHELT